MSGRVTAEMADWVERSRTAAGMSQTALAARLGCHKATVSRFEAGKGSTLIDRLGEVADIVGVPLPDQWRHGGPRMPFMSGDAPLALPPERRRDIVEKFLHAAGIAGPAAHITYEEIKIFSLGSHDFLEAVTDADRLPGGHDLLMDGLSEVTTPLAVHAARATPIVREGGARAERAFRIYAELAERWHAFRAEIAGAPCRHICPRSAIRYYVSDGFFPRDDALKRMNAPPPTEGQRAQHLRALLSLLENPRFELRLLDDREPVAEVFYLLKRDGGVFGELFPVSDEGYGLIITAPRLVEAVAAQFERIWATCAPADRATAAFLQEQLALIHE